MKFCTLASNSKMQMLLGSISEESGIDVHEDQDLSTNKTSLLNQSGVVSTGSSGDETVESLESTGAGIMRLCKPAYSNCFSYNKLSDKHEADQPSSFVPNPFMTELKQPSPKFTTSSEKNRIFSSFVSLSINPADLNDSALQVQSPVRLVKIEDDSHDSTVSPLYKGIETYAQFFDSLPNVSFYPYFDGSAVQNYFSSPQAGDSKVQIFERSPDKPQESSKDFDIISSMLSPLPFLVPVKFPARSPSNDRSDNDNEVSTGKRQGKTLERMLEYKNKKTKVSKGAKRCLPVKKRSHRPRRFSKSDDDDDYDESDEKENQSHDKKPLHTNASCFDPANDETSTNVVDVPMSYNVRSIQYYNPSEDVVALLAPTNATQVTFPVIDRCKCTKSRCLKLYCDCFQAGQVCTASCDCISCENTKNHSKPGGLRFQAIESILLRRPDAFEHRPKKSGEGCKCKKNR